MASRSLHRVTSVIGTAVATVLAVSIANLPAVQNAFALVPYFGRPAPMVLSDGDFTWAVLTTLTVVLIAMWPLFKPRPRRILDTILLTEKQVFLSMIGLAALGYFNYSYRLPRSTLMLTTICLIVMLPALTVLIRKRPGISSRAIIIGDDPETMEDILEATDIPVLGYVAPPSSYATGEELRTTPIGMADGGQMGVTLDELACLGGLSRLDEVFVKHDVDTALLAFADTDRAEFFGTLDACHDHGVTTMVHREHSTVVLTADSVVDGELVEVDVEPWDWQDYVVKRIFDLTFATAALLFLFPLIVVIALAIKLDSPGPVLYSQERTAEFGETFTVYKFRSMISKAELQTGATISNEDMGGHDPRVTRVGRFLRTTHLDEIPQLWSILVGNMSVVGPRPERPELDGDMEDGVREWRSRWFVKPGLTGLAQIRGATGYTPEMKLQYDIEYIRRQSFPFDVKIVIRQFWKAGYDVFETFRKTDENPD